MARILTPRTLQPQCGRKAGLGAEDSLPQAQLFCLFSCVALRELLKLLL